MNRRKFLSSLGIVAAVSSAPVILIETLTTEKNIYKINDSKERMRITSNGIILIK